MRQEWDQLLGLGDFRGVTAPPAGTPGRWGPGDGGALARATAPVPPTRPPGAARQLRPRIQALGAGHWITGLGDQRHPRLLQKPNSSRRGLALESCPWGLGDGLAPAPGPPPFRPPAWAPWCGLGSPALGRGHPGSQLPLCTPSGLGTPHSSDFPFVIIPEFYAAPGRGGRGGSSGGLLCLGQLCNLGEVGLFLHWKQML